MARHTQCIKFLVTHYVMQYLTLMLRLIYVIYICYFQYSTFIYFGNTLYSIDVKHFTQESQPSSSNPITIETSLAMAKIQFRNMTCHIMICISHADQVNTKLSRKWCLYFLNFFSIHNGLVVIYYLLGKTKIVS